VLYLQPVHQEALLHLAFLLDRKGDVRGAKRVRERAKRVHAAQAQAGKI